MNVRAVKRAMTAAVVTAGMGVLAAGCGSSSHTSGGTGGSTGSKGSASPILIGTAMSIDSSVLNDSDRKAGLEAAIAVTNAAGGINGHPLKLDFCDTQYNANREIDCARQMVSDHVVAVINPDFIANQTGAPYKVLAEAGIPVVGDSGLSPAGMASPNSFPLAGGLPGWVFGADDNAIKAGATKISLIQDTNPAAEFAIKLATAGLAEAKMRPVNTVTADPTSDPTFSAAAAKAIAGGTNGIVFAVGPENAPKLIEALRQAGYKGIISSLSALFPDQVITALKSAANGIYLTGQPAMVTDTSNPAVATFLTNMKKYEAGQPVDERTETGYAAEMLFAKVAATLKSYTPATVLAAMKSVKTPIDLGLIGPWKSVGAKSPISEFPQLGFNPTVWYGVVSNGTIVPAKGESTAQNPFVNLAEGK